MNSDHLNKIIRVLKWTRNVLLCQCLSTFVVCKMWNPSTALDDPEPALTWHVVLSTLGIMPFLSQTVIWFSNNNMYSPQSLKGNKYGIIHRILISVASCLLIAGIISGTVRKIKFDVIDPITNTARLKLIHWVTGFIAAILIICALLCYSLAFICMKFHARVPYVYFKSLHNMLVQFAYIMCIICLCTGYNTWRFKFHSPEGIPTILTKITIIEVIWPLSLVLKSLFQKIKFVTNFRKSTSQKLLVF